MVGKLDENIISTEKNTSGTIQSIKLKYNTWFTRIMRIWGISASQFVLKNQAHLLEQQQSISLQSSNEG